jgi:hypothetical protein
MIFPNVPYLIIRPLKGRIFFVLRALADKFGWFLNKSGEFDG